MIENFATGFSYFATIQNVVAIFAGMAIGVIVGALPGMGAAMAVAVALPFTFHLDPVTGILMLTGIYKGAFYGGSISAILIKTPGTPAAACTVLDGYPMARRGEGKRALDMALHASVFADMMSNLSLIFFTGIIASFALRFGPPEFFALIVFSLTIIAGVSGVSLSKGLASAALGFLAATVGQDLFYGTDRFAFGNATLMGGFNLVPLLIGMFALPEVMIQFERRYRIPERIAVVAQSAKSNWRDFKKCFPTIVRGSLIGVVIGAIPGIGGAPAAFLSYSEARRRSKNPENFGKGEIEGIAAAESGNNGVCGATMIPLLALGVPGDIITAIMLGAFMIHGLQPGPIMFKENIHIVYAIYCGIMLSSVMMFALGKVAIRSMARITQVPDRLVFPTVVLLCFFGAYVVNTSYFDLLVMILAGLAGYLMLKADIPAAPFLIAFVLGPLFEDNLRRSLLLSKGDLSIFVRGPICWFFLGLTVLALVAMVRHGLKGRRARNELGLSETGS